MPDSSASIDLNRIATEQRNPDSQEIDRLDSLGIVSTINREDQCVATAVERELPRVAAAVDSIVQALRQGGRLVYIGAGTSGRLGVLDASEIPPTFNADPGLVIGLIAGGDHAIRHPVEHVEDQPDAGRDALMDIGFTAKDVVVGIAASGRTPFVLGALDYAHSIGATTIGLCNSPASPIADRVSVCIVPEVGPEIVTGSTRMKAGTSQKMVLNILTTATMIQLGKTFGNLMVDVQPTNAKLRERAVRIVVEATGCEREAAIGILADCRNQVKPAIVAMLLGISPVQARERLESVHGSVRQALEAREQ